MSKARVYVSFAWKTEADKPIVKRLRTACAGQGIEVIQDKDAIPYRGSIKKFMDDLGRAAYVVVVLSERYVQSEDCMYELMEIRRNGDFHKRVFPVVVKGARLHKLEDWLAVRRYWRERIASAEAEIKADGLTGRGSTLQELEKWEEIQGGCENLLAEVSDWNALSEDAHVDSDFADLIRAILQSHAGAVAPQPPGYRPPDSPPRDDSLLERIEKGIGDALKKSNGVLLRMLQAQVPRQGPPQIARHLARELGIVGAIDLLEDAAQAALDQVGAAPTADRNTIKEAAKLLLGWIVLRAVSGDWWAAHRDLFGTERVQVEVILSTKTLAGVEILYSALANRSAELRTAGLVVHGGCCVPDHSLEWGIEPQFGVDDIKRVLWRVVFNGMAGPTPFTEDHDRTLRTTLERRARRGNHYYFAIPVDVGHPLQDPLILSKLRRDLKGHFLAVLVDKASGEESLVIDEAGEMNEVDLETILREFLNNLETHQP